jgi:chromate transporter
MQVCAMPEADSPDASPSFQAARRFWWRLGWISFGGPTGQIAIMHEEIVERQKWVDEASFLHALNFCLMLPGPEAQQLATYLGWRLHGTRGALCAGILFVLPAVFNLWGLSLVYVLFGSVPVVAAAFYGLVPAVIAIVIRALFRLGSRTLRRPLDWLIALAAVIAIGLSRESYPLVVLGAGLLGWIFRGKAASPTRETSTPIRLLPLLRTGGACLLAWWTPPLLALVLLGSSSTITREGFFFSKAALISFGGAYALLPYVAQHAVEQLHWLTPRDMLHGLALAETTPGPLIMVLQFVGFLGAWHQPGFLSPLLAATLGSLLTTWVTFAPSFLFILIGGPFVQRMTRIASWQAVLQAVSAAVVGVIANFALWFGGQALFPQHRLSEPDLFVLVIGAAALIALFRSRIGVIPLLAGCALAGIAYRILF